VPRGSLDALEDLSKQALRQVAIGSGYRPVAFGKLEDEIPPVADEPPAGLEQPSASK
jgi:hypothetical protein